MRTVDEFVAGLPAERRAKISARSLELIAEEKALRHVRRARSLTQQNMATLLKLDQASVSRIESRSDMLISTLRSYIEAMGGTLKLTAAFPDGSANIVALGDVDEPKEAGGVVRKGLALVGPES